MPKSKRYGDYNDENNEYVVMIPYCVKFLKEYAKSSRPRVYHRIVEFGIYCNHLEYYKQTRNTAIIEIQKIRGEQEIKEYLESKEYHQWFKQNYYKEHILKINTKESLEYFEKLVNQKPIKKTTKQHYYYFIDHYFNFVKDWKKAFENDDTFKNPLPAMKLCYFTGASQTHYDLEMNYQGPDLKSITRILAHIFYVIEDYRIFPALSLIFYSGARIREVCKIDIRLFFLKERWFKTKVKSRLSERWGWYFFPKFFIPVLEAYLEKRNKDYPNSSYLFPSKISDHLSPRTIQYHLENAKKSLGLKIYTNSHAFRDFLNTKRENIGLSKDKCKFLLNQKVGDVNPESYMKKYKNLINLRNMYDNFNPYKKLIKPEPKL